MSNEQCHVGAANKARIDANEKRVAELSQLVEEVFKRLEESQRVLLGRVDLLQQEFTRRLDRTLERFANRPAWSVMLVLSGLSSLCVGLIVYLISIST
ncbi:MAG: hypothetical protein ACYS30_21990 [Planctomycetota bacterium]|jgi:hypothetical protein